MTGRPRLRLTAAEYLALLGACTDADTMGEERGEPEDRRAAATRDRALSKIRASLTEADLRTVAKRFADS